MGHVKTLSSFEPDSVTTVHILDNRQPYTRRIIIAKKLGGLKCLKSLLDSLYTTTMAILLATWCILGWYSNNLVALYHTIVCNLMGTPVCVCVSWWGFPIFSSCRWPAHLFFAAAAAALARTLITADWSGFLFYRMGYFGDDVRHGIFHFETSDVSKPWSPWCSAKFACSGITKWSGKKSGKKSGKNQQNQHEHDNTGQWH